MFEIFNSHKRECKRRGEPIDVHPLKICGSGIYQLSLDQWERLDMEKSTKIHAGVVQNRTVINCFDQDTPYRLIQKGQTTLLLVLPPSIQTFLFLDIERDIPTSEEVYYFQNSNLNASHLVEKKWRIISEFQEGIKPGDQVPEQLSQLEEKLAFFIILVWSSNQDSQVRSQVLEREREFISHYISNPRVIALHLSNLEQEFSNPNYRRTLPKEWRKIHL